jgi:hypothetical protein
MTTFSEEEKDPQLEAMKDSLNSSSVLKIAILTIRSQLDEIPIFVFEGPDDKAAYSQWIRRISPGLAYEPLPANGKDQALKLWDSLIKDKDGLIVGIYVFVDRDFDDLKGRSPHQNLFMTQRYAVENYVVCPYVLDEILKDELHCHAQPNLRRDVVNHFSQAYASYLEIVKELNFTIYCARKLKITIDSLPKKISKIAAVNLDSVLPATPPCDTIIELEREITIDESAEHRAVFDVLDPSLRYRGKFLLLFFSKWIELLASERIHQKTPLMKTARTITKVGASSFSIGSLASRSSIPEGLEIFLNRIQSDFSQKPLLAEADTTTM